MVDLLTGFIYAVPWWLRLGVALIVMALGAIILFAVDVRIGIMIFGPGFVLLCFSGRSDAEKGGYNF